MSKATKSGAFKNIPMKWIPPVYTNAEDMINALLGENKKSYIDKFEKGQKNYLHKRTTVDFRAPRKQRRRLKERAIYGVTQSDFYSFGPYTSLIMLANMFRALPETPATKTLIELVVDLYDVLNHDADDYYYDYTKEAEYSSKQEKRRKDLYEKIKTQWGSAYAEALEANPNPNSNVSDFIFEYETLESLEPRDKTPWVEWRGIFSDPTLPKLVELKNELTVEGYKKVVKKHELQRTKFGFSDLDLTYAPFAFAHWQFVNALVYLASEESYVLNDAEAYLEYAKGFLAATAPQGVVLTVEQKRLAEKTVHTMPEFIPGLWD